MLLISHIIIALSGIILSTYTFICPSRRNIKLCVILTVATFISGTLLAVTTHSKLLQTCLAGLAYLAYMAVMGAAATYRMSYLKN